MSFRDLGNQLADCTELLKERLLLKMVRTLLTKGFLCLFNLCLMPISGFAQNDEAALARMKEIVRYSASLEPSFHAPESHVAFVKPTSK